MDGEDRTFRLTFRHFIISNQDVLIKRLSEKALNLSRSHSPRLLVSVRNVVEAESALAGGCHVLDLKEPDRGPLGMADSSTIAAVIAHIQNSNLSVPMSVALGEVVDWKSGRSVPRLSARISYLKLGTAGLGTGTGWTGHFGDIKRRFEAVSGRTFGGRGETASDGESPPSNWIAVAYADWEAANGPAPEDVIEMATTCGLVGVLIDTFLKANGGLFAWLTGDRLQSLAALARSRNLSLALAGRLQIGDIPNLLSLGPEIVGIRSAACRAGVRTGDIDAAAVRAFRQALDATRAGRQSEVDRLGGTSPSCKTT